MEFTKLHGMANDFLVVIVDDVQKVTGIHELSRRVCNRHIGAGADGLIIADCQHSPTADFRSRIFNADGSEAEVSGNGTRCLAAYLYYSALWSQPEVRIRTTAGVKTGRLVSHQGESYEFEFNMGRPILTSRDIPLSIEPPLDRVVGHRLEVGSKDQQVTCISMGNPHCSIQVSDLSDKNLEDMGPQVERHPLFPSLTNVEFIRTISRNEIEVRFWERGVGWTNSSGTGSCAAAVSSALLGLTDRTVKVKTSGGSLSVRWATDDVVYLTGAAEVIYKGKWLRPLS